MLTNKLRGAAPVDPVPCFFDAKVCYAGSCGMKSYMAGAITWNIMVRTVLRTDWVGERILPHT